jgi:hypothetical protein
LVKEVPLVEKERGWLVRAIQQNKEGKPKPFAGHVWGKKVPSVPPAQQQYKVRVLSEGPVLLISCV